jgi:hypothetical protein
MSMCLGLVTLAEASIQRIVDDPRLAWRFATPDAPELQPGSGKEPTTCAPGKKTGRKSKRTPKPPELALATGEGIRADLDRAWHGIHYLLTGTAWDGSPPLDFLINGGRQVGEIDADHGPLRVFSPAETRAVLDALSGISTYEMRKRFNPRDMAAQEVYPDIWSQEEESLAFLIDRVDGLRGFLRQAVEAEAGMLVFLLAR